MTKKEHPPCPNCGRSIGFEYVDVEPGKCQLWRWLNEGGADNSPAPRTVSDCFANTSRRIRELQAKIAELEESKKAAQRALSRRHTAAVDAALPEPVRRMRDMFPDGARIE